MPRTRQVGALVFARCAVCFKGEPLLHPFNGLDAPRNPPWVTSVGPHFLKESPSSYRDFKPVIWELEATHRLNAAVDLRLNVARHQRASSSIRESDTALVNPWITAALVSQLGGHRGWNLDHTPGDAFPEAEFTYALARSGDSPMITDPRYDDIRARVAAKNVGIDPIAFDGPLTSWTAGTSSRVTPQAGLSFRIADPVTLYTLYSQSIYPLVSFQPARTPAQETRLVDRYRQDGLPPPNLDALPWGWFFDPQYGESLEYGLKTELFRSKVMLNVSNFVIEKKNIARAKPEADPDSAAGFYDFTGAERASGLDVDCHARPLRGLQIGGGGLVHKQRK